LRGGVYGEGEKRGKEEGARRNHLSPALSSKWRGGISGEGEKSKAERELNGKFGSPRRPEGLCTRMKDEGEAGTRDEADP
jgi:hypothetical protein